MSNKHYSKAYAKCLKELHDLLKERLMRLPVELSTTLSELLEDFRVVSLRQDARREEILDDSVEERNIVLQELRHVSVAHSSN